jgi:hypothetical protein
MEQDLKNKEIILTAVFGALWGIMEISLGTLLHASRIPFRGTMMTIAAVVIITISRSFINYKGSVIAVCSIAATIKLITLPGFNITPFVAILAEGIIGEIIFSSFSYNLFTSVITGSAILLYTLAHSLVMQGIFFGFGIYNVYLDIMNSIGRAINYNGRISSVMIPLIVFFYVLLGSAAGWFGWRSAKRSKDILESEGL